MVSVIIPAYNCASSLGRCLDSVFSQDRKPLQVIVINDGSTDDTAEKAQIYEDKIIFLEQENQGQGAARNAGLKIATGEYVAFLDADDYWLPGMLSKCVDYLTEHKDAVAVSTGSLSISWNRRKRIIPVCIDVSDSNRIKEPIVLDNFFDFWAEHDHIMTGTNLIRRDLIETAGYQRDDLRISQDLEYWGYLATYGNWGFIPEVLFVTDGTPSASMQGWRGKYKKRRKLCPNVEQWEKRIVPRLKESEWSGFRIVRGRVAGGYAHAKILGGDFGSAREIVKKYGKNFQPSMITRLMNIGCVFGAIGWYVSCMLIVLREWIKALWISYNHK